MTIDTNRHDDLLVPHAAFPAATEAPALTPDLTLALDAIVDDIFMSVGQAVGLRASFTYDAVLWMRAHYRAKIAAALQHMGDRWQDDRSRVTAVAGMLGERCVRHAGGADVIDVEAVRQAAADVERYCQLHAARHGARDGMTTDASTGLVAGYWCTWDPKH